MNLLVYFVMPRYGQNLQKILVERNLEMSKASVFDLGLSLLDRLEIIHNSGFVYNDLKPDNILIGYRQQLPKSSAIIGPNGDSIFKNIQLNLVDFGLATPWRNNETGQHVEDKHIGCFEGNLYFCSQYQLEFKRTSR